MEDAEELEERLLAADRGVPYVTRLGALIVSRVAEGSVWRELELGGGLMRGHRYVVLVKLDGTLIPGAGVRESDSERKVGFPISSRRTEQSVRSAYKDCERLFEACDRRYVLKKSFDSLYSVRSIIRSHVPILEGEPEPQWGPSSGEGKSPGDGGLMEIVPESEKVRERHELPHGFVLRSVATPLSAGRWRLFMKLDWPPAGVTPVWVWRGRGLGADAVGNAIRDQVAYFTKHLGGSTD